MMRRSKRSRVGHREFKKRTRQKSRGRVEDENGVEKMDETGEMAQIEGSMNIELNKQTTYRDTIDHL